MVDLFPDPTSLSWRSLRIVRFLLMWRRRSNTKTDRPAIKATSNPPTTPAAIMGKPDVLKDRQKLTYAGKTQKWFSKHDMGWEKEAKPQLARALASPILPSTHLLFWQPARPGAVHLKKTNQG